jgi:thiosulfate/3-mercaptopyruvate sulfurtransferase
MKMTHYTTLISTDELAGRLHDPDWAVFDCRFLLTDPAAGRRAYLEGHIPGAVYVSLDEDLTGPIVPGKTGRHPLPTVEAFAETLSRLGVDERVQAVVYDDAGGMIAGRLWWMLRWMGHDAVALLDGGWKLWQREGRPVATGNEVRTRRRFLPRVRDYLVVDAETVLEQLDKPGSKLLDARSADRFRGENETLDPKAGHIPGAVCAPYASNLDADGRFLPAETLRARFETMLGGTPAEEAIFYCGSGVTAAHNLLALQHAGLGDARFYAGSWSDWITDPKRPMATGSETGAEGEGR